MKGDGMRRRDDLQPQRSAGRIRTLSCRYTRVAPQTEPVLLHLGLWASEAFQFWKHFDFVFFLCVCVPIFKSTVIFFYLKNSQKWIELWNIFQKQYERFCWWPERSGDFHHGAKIRYGLTIPESACVHTLHAAVHLTLCVVYGLTTAVIIIKLLPGRVAVNIPAPPSLWPQKLRLWIRLPLNESKWVTV